MDINDEVAVLRQHVEALQDQMRIVLMMLAQPAPEPAQETTPERKPSTEEVPILHDLKSINFPI
jgi:hypothetical protein